MKEPETKARRIRQVWEKAAETLTKEDVFVPIPPNFRTLNLEELQREKLLPDLIKAYQEVFGAEDIWGEGAFCDKEGWKKLISIQEYNKRKKEGKLKCECGGTFQPCYLNLEARIMKELSSKKSILVIMEGNEKWRVGGFTWGTVAGFPGIAKRILNARYLGRENKGEIELGKLRKGLEERRIYDSILYFDELGAIKEFRGLQPQLLLIRLMAEHGLREGTKRIIFWTAPNSPIYRLALGYGCESIHRTDEGLEFLLYPDFKPTLRVMQHFTEEKFRNLLTEIMKELLKPE